MIARILLSVLFMVATLFASAQSSELYKELFLNAGFESSENKEFLGITKVEFEDWTITADFESVIVETEDKVEGKQALKINASKQKENTISQDVFGAIEQPTPYATYELKINYKVLTSVDGGDVKIESFWSGAMSGEMEHDADKLKTGFFSASEWTEKVIETTCPDGANRFTFQVKVPKGAVVLFDNFSFRRKQTTNPEMNIKYTTTHVTADINTSVDYPAVIVEQANLTKPIQVEITGADRQYFTASVTSIPAKDGNTEIIVTYKPTAVGTHSAMLNVEAGDKVDEYTSLYKSVKLTAVCTDPTQKAIIRITPATMENFEVVVGEERKQTLALQSSSCLKPIDVLVTHFEKAGFVVSGSQFPQNIDVNIDIVFKPTSAGEYHSQVVFSSDGAETVILDLTGTAISDPTEPEKFETDFKFDWKNPQKLIYEKFENVSHNNAIQIDKWQNTVVSGKRPWWGFEHKESIESVDILERSAKATSYGYQMPSDGSRAEMWLVTPVLDYKNADGRIFTFRVMGDFMPEKHDTELSVWLIDSIPGDDKPYFSKIDGIGIPATADLNGEWSEIHLNLENQDISDVFCIGFKYDGVIGEDNAVVYYIDDVSWGRTDLPVISHDSVAVRMVAAQSQTAVSGVVTVTAENLSEPVRLSLGGANSSHFEVMSVDDRSNMLSPEGGGFIVGFQSDDLGVHEAYVKLSSRGAADTYIPLVVLCTDKTSLDNVHDDGVLCRISDNVLVVEAAGLSEIYVYDTAGRVISSVYADSDKVSIGMPYSGVYVVKIHTVSGLVVRKVVL